MLSIRNLYAGYDKLQILFGVEFDAARSAVTLIIGPNGAGKSTVLKCIFNLTEKSAGQVAWMGEDITRAKTHMLITRGLVYIPQGRPVFPNLSVKENILLGAVAQRGEKARLMERLDRVFADFPILALKQKQPARLLSGGQQQLLALGRALMSDPKLLLLDEPSLGLSPVMTQFIFETIVRLKNERGIGTLLVEQNAKAASVIADKVILLEQGRVALMGGREVMNDPRLKNVYVGGV